MDCNDPGENNRQRPVIRPDTFDRLGRVLSTIGMMPHLGIDLRNIDVFQVWWVVDHVEDKTTGTDEVRSDAEGIEREGILHHREEEPH
jgi:hypothetical protein